MSFERREAVVTYEQGAVTIEQMNQALARYGFTVGPMQSGPLRP